MRNLLVDTPSQAELCACLAQDPAAPLLPPLSAPFWQERFAWPHLRRVTEVLRYRSPENPDATVRRLILRPAVPAGALALAYTVQAGGSESARRHQSSGDHTCQPNH